MRHPRSQKAVAPNLNEWAKTEICVHLLGGSPNRHDTELGRLPRIEHPAILTQAALEETFRPASPLEVYSDDQPSFTPQAPEQENWIPIDVLLGIYQFRSRKIKIFHKNIVYFADATFNCKPSDLEFIVRLHEYAHALIHLGLFWKDEPDLIRKHATGHESDWKSYLRTRSAAFRSLPAGVHEFLAQVLCWITIGKLEPLVTRYEFQELFIAIMERQPSDYVLAPEVLGKACYADPTVLLSWARNPQRSRPPHRRAYRQAAESLILATFP